MGAAGDRVGRRQLSRRSRRPAAISMASARCGATFTGIVIPRSIAALREQLDRIAHSTFLGLTHEPGIGSRPRLLEVAPPSLKRVFYSDSGSTAVEIALKQSFQYWSLRGQPTKQKFLRLGDAYHGDTLGAVGVGGIESVSSNLRSAARSQHRDSEPSGHGWPRDPRAARVRALDARLRDQRVHLRAADPRRCWNARASARAFSRKPPRCADDTTFT